MERKVTAETSKFSVSVAATRRNSQFCYSPTKGVFTRTGIDTIEEPRKKREVRVTKAKECELLYKAYSDVREENIGLRGECQSYRNELLDVKTKLLATAQENEKLNEKVSQLEQNGDWGQLLRNKDEELHRLHELVRKMSYDRAAAMNNKSAAELAIDDLKSKLRHKDKEVRDFKEVEKIQSKAKILNETESLRNERDIAVAELSRKGAVLEKLKQEVSQATRISEERKMVIQEIHKRLTSKEKHIDELRKQLAVSRLFNK